MTVDDLIDWLNASKFKAGDSGQDISNYPVVTEDIRLFEPKIDHGLNAVILIEVE